MSELEMEQRIKSLPESGAVGFTVDTHAKRQRISAHAHRMKRYGLIDYRVRSEYNPATKEYEVRRAV